MNENTTVAAKKIIASLRELANDLDGKLNGILQAQNSHSDPGVGPTKADQVEEVRLAMLSIYGVYRDYRYDADTRLIAGKAYYAAESLFEQMLSSVEATT